MDEKENDQRKKLAKKLEQMMKYECVEIDDELLFQCEWGYYTVKKEQIDKKD